MRHETSHGAASHVRVLYLSHTSRISGAERSLLDLLAALPAEVSPTVACPAGGLDARVRAMSIPVIRVPGTDGSLRLHPRHTTRALTEMLGAALMVRRAAARVDASLVHANSVRAGLVGVLAHRLGGPPVIVHLRDCMPPSAVTGVIRRLISRQAAMLVTNSDYTAASFLGGDGRARVRTLHSLVDLSRFRPDLLTRHQARRRLGLDLSIPVVGVVAQLTPWKGQEDAIRAVALIRRTLPDLRLLIVGGAVFTSPATRLDNQAYSEHLHHLAAQLSVDGSVDFLGERDDVPVVLRALDVALVPSWEEPFGRSVVEAMAMELPVIATRVGGPVEVIRHGIDGVLLAPRAPQTWARAIAELIGDPAGRHAMGSRARTAVTTKFSAATHAARLLDIYREALG
jgi:L-malate glycosyltransferase